MESCDFWVDPNRLDHSRHNHRVWFWRFTKMGSLYVQVLGLVRLTLMRKIVYNVTKERSIVGLMTTMYDMYEKLSANNNVYFMKNLFNLKMTKRISITQHLIISTLSQINCYMVKLSLMMSYEHWYCWFHFQIVGPKINSKNHLISHK